MNNKNLGLYAFIFTAFLFLTLAVTNGVPFIYSDGYAAYHTVNSIVEKKSWISDTEPEYIDYRGHVLSEFKGKYPVVYPPGAAIFNLPLQIIAHQFENDKTIYNDYFKATNGHTLEEGVSFIITACIIGLLTIYIMYKFSLNFQNTYTLMPMDRRITLFSVAAGYIASYSIWYVILNPSFTHTYELFGVAILLYGLLDYQRYKDFRSAAITGFGVGIATISRPVLIILGIMPALYMLYIAYNSYRLNKSFKKSINGLAGYVLGGLPLAILFMWYNKVSYGKYITSGYDEIRGEKFIFDSWNGLKILFSFERGWFIYSPIFFIAVLGFLILWKKSKFWSFYGLSSILMIITIYGFWPAWWAGGSYGHRFMIPLAPFGIYGITYFVSYIAQKSFKKSIELSLYTICVILVFWSLLLTLLYRFTPVAELRPISDSEGRMLSGDRYTPYDMIKFQFELAQDAKSPGNYINKLIENGNGGTSLVPYFMGTGNTTFRVDEREPGKLKILKLIPPFKINYTLSSTVDIYIKSKDEVYKMRLINVPTVDEYILDTNQFAGENIERVDNGDTMPKELDREMFTAIILKDGTEIYFRNTDKIFFKGSPINLRDGEYSYRL